MRDLEAALLPREHLDEARGLLRVAPLQSHPRLLINKAELEERRPVPLEQPNEFLLAPSFDPISADDDRITCFRHAGILSIRAK